MLVIDQDDMEQFKDPKATLTIITRNGKRHHYYTNSGEIKNRDLREGKKHVLEVRAEWRYVAAPGSYVPPDKDSLADGTGLYRVENGTPPTILYKKDLPPALQEPQRQREVTLTGGTFRNKHGWAIENLRRYDIKLNRLLNNDNSNYPSASEADMATLSKLLFWEYTDSEAAEILKSFRMREKLNRKGYIEKTLSKIDRRQTISNIMDAKEWTPDETSSTENIEEILQISEEEARHLQPETLAQLHTINQKWLEMTAEDREFLEVVYAVAIDQMIPGDPIWIYLIAPSGGMKTAAARSLQKYSRIYSLDTLTVKTLISGLSEKNKKTGKVEPIAGLLKYMDGKTLVIKDFTTVLSQPTDARNEIFGQLRAIYDGYFEKGFGSLPDPVRIRASIALILCVTPVIDKYTKAHSALGERLLKIRQHPDAETTTRRSVKNLGKEKRMRFELQMATTHYLSNIDFAKIPKMSDEDEGKLVDIALYLAKGRTTVFKDYVAGQISNLQVVASEMPTRVVKQLKKLAMALALIRGKDTVSDEEMRTVVRVAEDTVNPVFKDILDAIYHLGGRATGPDVEKECFNTHPQRIKNNLKVMRYAKLLQYGVEDEKPIYAISTQMKRYIDTINTIKQYSQQ